MRHLVFFVALVAWAQQNDDLSRHAVAAAAALQSGDYTAAERENREILRLQPNLPEAEMNLGISCFLQRKYAEAIPIFKAALQQRPDMSPARLFIGISYFNLNQLSSALSPLKRYALDKPDDLQGQYYLGLTCIGLGRNVDAEKALLSARRVDPRNIDVLYHLAQTYVGEARQFPDRRSELANAYSATFTLGRVRFRKCILEENRLGLTAYGTRQVNNGGVKLSQAITRQPEIKKNFAVCRSDSSLFE